MNLRRAEGRPLVIGHRGAAAVAPENTLAALEAAVAARVDLVEFDILPGLRLGHSLDELPLEAITLEEAFEFLKAHGVGVHLDVKLPGYEDQVLEAIRRHGVTERAVISTAFAVTARRFARLAPSLPRFAAASASAGWRRRAGRADSRSHAAAPAPAGRSAAP